MRKKFKSCHSQCGISLLEVLLSLSIIAIILVMATRYFFVASHNNKINTTVSQVGGLIAAAHNWKGANASYASDSEVLSVKTLGEAGQLTNFPGFDPKSNTLSTMWGSDITIQKGSANRAMVTVPLPDRGACTAVEHAYPSQGGNIDSECSNFTFVYSFP